MSADHTLAEVGQRFSVSRERIRQIEAKALRRLKHSAELHGQLTGPYGPQTLLATGSAQYTRDAAYRPLVVLEASGRGLNPAFAEQKKTSNIAVAYCLQIRSAIGPPLDHDLVRALN